MTFIWPAALLLLLVLPLLVAWYLRLQRRRSQLAARYGTLGLVQAPGGGAPRPLGWRRHLPPALFLAGLAVLLVALARPQMVVSLPRLEGTVILAFDVSGSMAADDLKPTRMEAAKEAARAFVDRQPPTVQVGVVSFSDSGFAVQPPTNEQATILAAIDRLRPERGTSLAHGILTALNAIFIDEDDTAEKRAADGVAGEPGQLLYSDLTPAPTPSPTPVPPGTYAPAVIVLLSDGENTAPPDPLEAVQVAADRGVRVYTIGIGSAEGATLEIEGFSIHTQLDEQTLQAVAERTGGTYFNAADAEELRSIYTNLNPELGIAPEKMEVTALFAGVSALLLLIGGAFSLLWFSRLP
ncbi:MAG: VWA domain-containing protein [Caldilineaceae bacterium]